MAENIPLCVCVCDIVMQAYVYIYNEILYMYVYKCIRMCVYKHIHTHPSLSILLSVDIVSFLTLAIISAAVVLSVIGSGIVKFLLL